MSNTGMQGRKAALAHDHAAAFGFCSASAAPAEVVTSGLV